MIKNLKIGKKLVVSFIVVAIIASLSGILSIFSMNQINRQHEDALVNYGFSQGDIGKALVSFCSINRCVRDVINFTEIEDVQAAKDEMETFVEKYNTYKGDVERTLVTEEEKRSMIKYLPAKKLTAQCASRLLQWAKQQEQLRVQPLRTWQKHSLTRCMMSFMPHGLSL